MIGQRAGAVSGGQRQRICLARALADTPQMLVLDEPTSALDVRSEEGVRESLDEIKADTVLVLVAHRLSTLSMCDRIVVMVDGQSRRSGATPIWWTATTSFEKSTRSRSATRTMTGPSNDHAVRRAVRLRQSVPRTSRAWSRCRKG